MKPVTFITDLMDEQNRHEECFGITDEGMVFLKPEYRGAYSYTKEYAMSDNGQDAGSKNAELPKQLAIPVSVNGVRVRSLAPFMFCGNSAIEELTIPKHITEISECMCQNAENLKHIFNTEGVEVIGRAAFKGTKLEKADFPSLKTLAGDSIFYKCWHLKSAEIGSVTTIPSKTFGYCTRLSYVTGGERVTAIADRAFFDTFSLKTLDCLTQNVTSIGDFAFLSSGLTFNWNSLASVTYGKYATENQINPDDFWKDCTWVECENPLPTHLFQVDPQWANEPVIGSGNKKQYQDGCLFFSIMHAYCGLHNITATTVDELENIVTAVAPNFEYFGAVDKAADMCKSLGMVVETYEHYNGADTDAHGKSGLQHIYDALAAGKYVIAYMNGSVTMKKVNGEWAEQFSEVGHTVLLYGVNDKGEFLVANSDGGGDDKIAHIAPYQNFFFPDPRGTDVPEIVIVSKPTTVTYDRYKDIATALTDGSATTENGAVGKYTDADGLHLVLLEDVLSLNATININKTCTLHLNGHTISFGAGKQLSVSAANVVIDGTVPGSAIKKDGVVSSAAEKLVVASGDNLTVRGGTYSVINASGKAALPISTGANKAITIDGCKIIASGLGTTQAMGVEADFVTMDGCVIDISSENAGSTGVKFWAQSTIKDCTVRAGSTSPAMVLGIACQTTSTVAINNCDVTVNGVLGGSIGYSNVTAVSTYGGGKNIIKGGFYKSPASCVVGGASVEIDEGSFEAAVVGCATSGTEFKAKNATFRIIEGGSPEAACLVNSANATFYNCSFESDYDATVPTGVSAKASGAVVNISDCEFGAFESDLSAVSGATINVGSGVDFNTVSGAGTVNGTGVSYSW